MVVKSLAHKNYSNQRIIHINQDQVGEDQEVLITESEEDLEATDLCQNQDIEAIKTRYLDQAGFRKLLITNEKDLELLLTNNRVFAGELAHNLSARKRATLVRRAAELNVRLTNGKGKVRAEEKKE